MLSRVTIILLVTFFSYIHVLNAQSRCTCSVTSVKNIPTDTNRLFITSNKLLADEVYFYSPDKSRCANECEKIKKQRQDIWGVKNAQVSVDFTDFTDLTT